MRFPPSPLLAQEELEEEGHGATPHPRSCQDQNQHQIGPHSSCLFTPFFQKEPSTEPGGPGRGTEPKEQREGVGWAYIHWIW